MNHLLIIRLHAPEHVEEREEEVEDVKVKNDGGPDVLVVGVALN